MSRLVLIGTAITLFACVLSACGGSHGRPAQRTETVVRRAASSPASADEILSLSGLGEFEGRCPPGARSWTVRFVSNPPLAEASETFVYRVGTGPRRTVEVNGPVTIQLVPDAAETREPADRYVPPIGQGRGLAGATSVKTTEPLQALIYQGTEPQTLRADVDLAFSTIGGGDQCALVGSSVKAYTYPN